MNCNKSPILIESNQNQAADTPMAGGWTIVLDVGKSLSKVTLWDEAGICVAHCSRPNRGSAAGGRLTLDVVGIEQWLESVLKAYALLGPVSAIIPVAHGAGIALIRDDRLLCAPLDYEWPDVARDRAIYNQQRDEFADTGSPALPAGLNLGMQLHWLESSSTGDYGGSQLLPWAQYWAWNLSGVPASELTSLGCHSDLWRPFAKTPSQLAVRRGWAERMAPLQPAGAVLGTIKQDWAQRTGLSGRVKVYCGLHDSNAALLAARSQPAMMGRDATVLSTGTWFVAMRSPLPKGAAFTSKLPETRDCLVNVDVTGAPVPSSRFMGGREIEVLMGAHFAGASAENLTAQQAIALRSIEAGDLLLPSAAPGLGPFPNAKLGPRPQMADLNEAIAKTHLYAALVADVSLDLIGSRDTLFVDGRFSHSPIFVSALAALRPDTTVLVSEEEHGVARGALRLVDPNMIDPNRGVSPTAQRVAPLPADLSAYRQRWRLAAERAG
jgi:sugar (pentulose or hexulose) kinase